MFIRLLKPSESKKKKEIHREGGEVTAPHLSYGKAMMSLSRYEKAMTSLSLSRQEAEGENRRDSFYMHRRKLVTGEITPIYQYKTSMYSVKPSEDRKEQKESQFKWADLSLLHQSDVMDDGIKVEVGTRENVNKLVGRQHHTASKHSCSHVKEDDNSSMTISEQFLVQLAFIFIMVVNAIRSGLNVNSLKLKWVIGLATLVCGRTGCVEPAGSPPTLPPDSFGGKRFEASILLSTNVYASWMHYFDRYSKNLDFEYGTRSFYKLVYLYICAFDSSWMTWEHAILSSKIATLACNKLYTLVYLLSEWSFSVIRIHDKYHRQFLVGLALAC